MTCLSYTLRPTAARAAAARCGRTLARVPEPEPRELIDRARQRDLYYERQREYREHPERSRLTQRAVVRIVDNFLKEARTGEFTFRSDEHAPLGTGAAPSPLQYFVAAVGF